MGRGAVAVAVLWLLAVVVAGVTIASWLADPTPPGVPWQSAQQLADFRDTIFGPGGFLLSGGNPYDPDTYLAAHPWAQEFDPYAPAWLLLAVPLAVLPFEWAAAVYLMSGFVVAVVLLRVLLRWTIPAWVIIGTPIGLIWFYVWSPGRYTMQNSGTLLVMLGWVLVLRAVITTCGGARSRDAVPSGYTHCETGVTALGVALSLLKPQFGLPLLVVAIAAGRWNAVWRGVAGLAVASTPVVVACSVAAGGFGGFVDSVVRDLEYATSGSAALSLSSPLNGRSDLVGILARLDVGVAPLWLALAAPLAALLVSVLVVARNRSPISIAAGVSSAILLGFPHAPYDNFVMIVPFCIGLGLIGGASEPGRTLDLAIWLVAAVPVLHLHRVSGVLLPGLSDPGLAAVDVGALLLALMLCLYATSRSSSAARHGQGMISVP